MMTMMMMMKIKFKLNTHLQKYIQERSDVETEGKWLLSKDVSNQLKKLDRQLQAYVR